MSVFEVSLSSRIFQNQRSQQLEVQVLLMVSRHIHSCSHPSIYDPQASVHADKQNCFQNQIIQWPHFDHYFHRVLYLKQLDIFYCWPDFCLSIAGQNESYWRVVFTFSSVRKISHLSAAVNQNTSGQTKWVGKTSFTFRIKKKKIKLTNPYCKFISKICWIQRL